MGMFTKKDALPLKSPSVPAKGAPAGVGLSIVGSGMTVHGDLETEGVVKVEGTVDGHVSARTQVLVAKEGLVRGDIDTTEAIIGGTVHGAIRARERVEVQSGAAVHGDIATRRILVAEGGNLNGQIRMGESAATQEMRSDGSKAAITYLEPAGGSRPA
jgi:cytoskeletal protein CcmA (bactofilin family)